jgi:catalase
VPLPDDAKLLTLANDILHQFDAIFGVHPGFRPAHAKGAMFTGTFTPAAGGTRLTKAPHVTRPSTPVTARFSNSTGIPVMPDNDPNARPHGLAVRFHLGEHVHTDIVSHSTDGFPTHTGAEFLELLRAIASSDPKNLAGSPLERFLGSHPAALAFVQAPKPAPVSFATETYFGVSAMRFTNAGGTSRFGRFCIVPAAGNAYLDDAARSAKSASYLFDEIASRVRKEPVQFTVLVQVAGETDTVDDATVHWPADRPLVELGSITLTAPVANDAAAQQQIIFDPIPRVDGIEPSADPLLELRAALYLISGRRRRAGAKP